MEEERKRHEERLKNGEIQDDTQIDTSSINDA
jgi:hypothetical protein